MRCTRRWRPFCSRLGARSRLCAPRPRSASARGGRPAVALAQARRHRRRRPRQRGAVAAGRGSRRSSLARRPGGDRRAMAKDPRRSGEARRRGREDAGPAGACSRAASCRRGPGAARSLERAKGAVDEYQARVDALELRARNFRRTLGHAIDALSRDRSRELAHLEAIAALRGGIHEEAGGLTSRRRAAARDPRLGVGRGPSRGVARPGDDAPISTTRSRRFSSSSTPRTASSKRSSRTRPANSREACRPCGGSPESS